MGRNWLAVASKSHVERGKTGGFMQVCHGKAAPLRRIRPDDRVAYYSPTITMGGHDKCQSFTAFGVVAMGEPYAFDMGDGFVPFRRNVIWAFTRDAPIGALKDSLALTKDKNWGYALRFGLLEISDTDMEIIGAFMTAPA